MLYESLVTFAIYDPAQPIVLFDCLIAIADLHFAIRCDLYRPKPPETNQRQRQRSGT